MHEGVVSQNSLIIVVFNFVDQHKVLKLCFASKSHLTQINIEPGLSDCTCEILKAIRKTLKATQKKETSVKGSIPICPGQSLEASLTLGAKNT